jgi:hypothetical protein
MKIHGPGPGAPPAAADSKLDGKDEVGRAGSIAEPKKPFTVGETGAARRSTPASKLDSRAVAASSLTSDIAAELRAGKLPLAAAIDKVVDRVLDRQLGANAPAPIRDKVRAALREAIENDPLLAQKLKDLSG